MLCLLKQKQYAVRLFGVTMLLYRGGYQTHTQTDNAFEEPEAGRNPPGPETAVKMPGDEKRSGGQKPGELFLSGSAGKKLMSWLGYCSNPAFGKKLVNDGTDGFAAGLFRRSAIRCNVNKDCFDPGMQRRMFNISLPH